MGTFDNIPNSALEEAFVRPKIGVQTIDMTGKKYEFEPTGNLYVKRDIDQTFIPRFAKELDVGIDLPVKIHIDRVKFTASGEEPDKLRYAMLHPDLRHYIFENGDPYRGEPRPYLYVPPKGWAELPSGISIKLPDDAWGLIKNRSSTGWCKHLEVEPSTIDPGYTGLLGTLVFNPNDTPVKVYEYDPKTKQGDCLSQLILIPTYPLKNILLVDELPKTKRGSTGFGSSAINA